MYEEPPESSEVIPTGGGGYDAGQHGVETTYTGYAREIIDISSISGVNKTVTKNDTAIEFGQNTGAEVVIKGWVVFDAATGGNALYVLRYSSGSYITIGNLQTPRIEADKLEISEE